MSELSLVPNVFKISEPNYSNILLIFSPLKADVSKNGTLLRYANSAPAS